MHEPIHQMAPAVWTTALVGTVALFVGLGLARFGYSPLIPALVRAGWFGAATADFLASVNLVGYIIGAALTARWLARRAPAAWLRAGMLTATVSLGACALNWGFAWYFFWRLLAGIAAGVLMVLAVPAILQRMPARARGVAGGVLFAGAGCGMIFSGEVIPYLVRLGLPAAWLLLALLASVLSALVWRAWDRAAPAGAAVTGGGDPASRSAPRSLPSAAPAAAMVLLMAAYCCNAIGFAPQSLFWVDYIARQLGRGLVVGGHDYLLFGVGVAVGPMLAGWFGDRFGLRRSFACGLGLEALGLALPVWGTGAGLLAISSLLVGAAGMGSTTIASARTMELARPRERTRAWGHMTLAFAIAYAGAGMGFSGVYAHLLRYQPIFLAGAVALALGAIMAAFAG
ncbi:MAG: YbfB/YjiJ family MFS transporter [Terriglobales bacterium]